MRSPVGPGRGHFTSLGSHSRVQTCPTEPEARAMDPLIPDDVEEMLMHVRDYQVRAYRVARDRVLLRGAVRDRKPAGLYVPGDDEPLDMHHMIVDLEIVYPTLTIDKVTVDFVHHPEDECPNIVPAFQQLVGISIARGFSRKLKELLAGPLGCTHVMALLNAMAPVAVQCVWSMHFGDVREGRAEASDRSEMTDDELLESTKFSRNTCHVWADGGPAMERVMSRQEHKPPIPVRVRMKKLGIVADDWRALRTK